MENNQINAWNVGYGLDLQGHSFSEPHGYWAGKPVFLWERPNSDLIPALPPCALLVVAPNGGHFPEYEFPREFSEDGARYTRVALGLLRPSDRDCGCWGQFAEWTGTLGQGAEPANKQEFLRCLDEAEGGVESMVSADILPLLRFDFDGVPVDCPRPVFWKYTGSVGHAAQPGCFRCNGEGYVDGPGGDWAAYVRVSAAP